MVLYQFVYILFTLLLLSLCCFAEKANLVKSEDMIKQLEDEKQWLEQESKHLVDESEKKLESVRAAELQELRRGKVEALQLLQVSQLVHVLLYMYYYKMGWLGDVMVGT